MILESDNTVEPMMAVFMVFPMKFFETAAPAAPRPDAERPMAMESIVDVSLAVKSTEPVAIGFKIPAFTLEPVVSSSIIEASTVL